MPDPVQPTHVSLDGAVHKIARVEEALDGPGHTHRVHLGCGMTVDVDINGVRAHARALERLGHVQGERNLSLRAIHVELHTKAAAEAVKLGETWASARWMGTGPAVGCPNCQLMESGAPPRQMPLNHTAPTTREADINTGVPCPKCGSLVYKRRYPGPKELEFGCTAQGHEFTGPELMDGIRLSVENLTKLVKE